MKSYWRDAATSLRQCVSWRGRRIMEMVVTVLQMDALATATVRESMLRGRENNRYSTDSRVPLSSHVEELGDNGVGSNISRSGLSRP